MTSPESPSEQPPVIDGTTARPVSRWRWWVHLVLIGAYPAIVGLLGRGRMETRGPALSHDARGLLLACGLELVVFGVVFALGWLASRATREQLLWRWRPGWLVVPLGAGYSVVIRMAVGVVVVAVCAILVLTHVFTADSLKDFVTSNRPDVETVVDPVAMRSNPVYFWLTVTLVSFVVAGLREEVWRGGTLAALRALWPRAFSSRRGEVLAVALLAVVFGFGHLPMGVIAVAVTGFLGLLLGIIMVMHRSIWPAVLAHGFFDATSLALLPWALEQLKSLPLKPG